MKRATQMIFIAFVLALAMACQQTPAPAAQTAAAQQSTAQSTGKKQLYNFMIRRPAGGMGAEYDNFHRTEMNPLRIKGGLQRMDVWQAVRGRNGARVIIQPIENMADLDNPIGINRVLDPKARDAFFQKAGRMLAEEESYTMESLPELSWTSPRYKEGMQKAAVLRFFKVAYGRERELEDYWKNHELPARQKIPAEKNLLGQWRYRLRYGGDAYTYLVMRPLENFAELDEEKGLRGFYGQAEAQKIFDKLPPGVVVSDEVWLLRFRPDLSIVNGKVAGQ